MEALCYRLPEVAPQWGRRECSQYSASKDKLARAHRQRMLWSSPWVPISYKPMSSGDDNPPLFSSLYTRNQHVSLASRLSLVHTQGLDLDLCLRLFSLHCFRLQ